METAKIAFNFIFQGGPGPAPDPVNPPYVPGGGGAATGDALFWIIGILMLISAAAFAFNVLNRKFSLVQGKHIKGNFGQAFNFISQDKVKLVLASISALFVALFLTVAISNISAAYAEENVLMVGNSDEMTITCTVDENGNISIPDTIYKNEEQYDASFVSSKVEISSEAKNPEALAAANFNVTGLGGNMFVGNPGESYTIVDSLQKLKAGSETTLSFVLSNLSTEEALNLCDTTPFYLYLDYTLDAPMKTATVDLNKGQISIFGHAPEGWVEDDGNYVKDFVVDTQYSDIIAEWNGVDYYYPSMSIVSWDPSEGNLVEDTTFTANWEFTDWFKPLDWYSWSDLSFISDDIAQNYDWFWGSTSPYYPKFREFAEFGATKTFYLTNGDKMAVRIIGINQDFKRNWDRSGLTFTAVHALSQAYAYDASGYENWPKSDLCQSMNQPDGEIYNLLPWDLKMNIVGVNKLSSKGYDDFRNYLDTECEVDNEKLFVASANELGLEPGSDLGMIYCADEGFKYDYWNRDPYSKYRNSDNEDNAPFLTSLSYEGYRYVLNHIYDFDSVSSAYSYCLNNDLAVTDSLHLYEDITLTRTLLFTKDLPIIKSNEKNDIFTSLGICYYKAYTSSGTFGYNETSLEGNECLKTVAAPIVPCFSLGKEVEQEYVNVFGNVKISRNPRDAGHTEKMHSGLKVTYTYEDGRETKNLDAYTDQNGNFFIMGIPRFSTGTVSFNYMGYHDEANIWCGDDIYGIMLNAEGPYLNYYSWDEIKEISDLISNDSISPDLMNEFKNYAEKGEVKDVPLNHYGNYDDHLYVRIADFKADLKVDYDPKNPAGITFIAVNSINNTYTFNNVSLSENLSNYAKSNIRDMLNENGEVYNLLPEDLQRNLLTVSKESAKGWVADPFLKQAQVTNEKLFLPSYTELGGNDPKSPVEGKKYTYISNDPYAKEDFDWYPTGDVPALCSANAKGYNWILENGDNLDWDSLVELGSFESCFVGNSLAIFDENASGYVWTRTLNPEEKNIFILGANKEFSYISNFEAFFLNNVGIAPCFCVGSNTVGRTTRNISGSVGPTAHPNAEVTLLYRYNNNVVELRTNTDSTGKFEFTDIPLFANFDVSCADNGRYAEIKDQYLDKDYSDLTLHLSSEKTLNGYTWPQLKEIAKAFSDGSVDTDTKKLFIKFAETGSTKKVRLNTEMGEDYLYVRIADFTRDNISETNGTKKAGITFIPVNSINKPFNYQNIIEQLTKSTHNWATSDIRESLNNGEIYNMMPQDLLDVVVPVDKQSCEGWSDISIEDFPDFENIKYSDTLQNTSDKFFIPSYAEIYDNVSYSYFSNKEGEVYKYISNDPYAQKCKEYGIEHPNTPFLNALSYKGFEYLFSNDALWTEYKSQEDIYKDCGDKGGVIINTFGSTINNTMGRSVIQDNEEDHSMLVSFVLFGPHFIYGNEIEEINELPEDYLVLTSLVATTVAPCFCL